MRCKLHPKYKGIRMPRAKQSLDCICSEIYFNKNTSQRKGMVKIPTNKPFKLSDGFAERLSKNLNAFLKKLEKENGRKYTTSFRVDPKKLGPVPKWW
jgi:hypothetical protein